LLIVYLLIWAAAFAEFVFARRGRVQNPHRSARANGVLLALTGLLAAVIVNEQHLPLAEREPIYAVCFCMSIAGLVYLTKAMIIRANSRRDRRE
jgi:hypothetical protein